MSQAYPNLRIQDLVARTARVNLRDTVRVLRALAIAAQSTGHNDLAADLNDMLLKSARMSNFPAPLHSKPDAKAIDACDDAYEDMAEDVGDNVLNTLSDLSDDPYFENKR